MRLSLKFTRFAVSTALALSLVGCAVKEPVAEPPKKEAPIEKPKEEEAPKTPEIAKKVLPLSRSQKAPSSIVAIAPTEAFYKALDLSIGYYDSVYSKNAKFNFYDNIYDAKEMAASLKLFKEISKLPKEKFLSELDNKFALYESKNEKESALITGYYAPVLKGSFVKTERFNAPIYPVPKDMITVDLKKFPTANSVRDIVGKVEANSLVPYYTREQIEKGALKEKPIMYLDNKVELFLLGVQGSGIVEIEGKKYYVGYAGKNGRPYTSIGKVILEEGLIESSKLNMQTIKKLLNSDEKLRDRILNKNESYVFFKINKKEGIFGNINLPLTSKESVAMDSELIPRGALCYIKTEIPKKLNGYEVVDKKEREPFEKFFMIQDTGGAIRGGGRVDVYFGEGDEGLFYAGQTASKGEVYLLVAKKEALGK